MYCTYVRMYVRTVHSIDNPHTRVASLQYQIHNALHAHMQLVEYSEASVLLTYMFSSSPVEHAIFLPPLPLHEVCEELPKVAVIRCLKEIQSPYIPQVHCHLLCRQKGTLAHTHTHTCTHAHTHTSGMHCA